MAFPIVTSSPMYTPKDALIHMDSLKMLLQEYASAYPSDIIDSNYYLLEYHALLYHHIMILLQDHSMSPANLPYILTEP